MKLPLNTLATLVQRGAAEEVGEQAWRAGVVFGSNGQAILLPQSQFEMEAATPSEGWAGHVAEVSNLADSSPPPPSPVDVMDVVFNGENVEERPVPSSATSSAPSSSDRSFSLLPESTSASSATTTPFEPSSIISATPVSATTSYTPPPDTTPSPSSVEAQPSYTPAAVVSTSEVREQHPYITTSFVAWAEPSTLASAAFSSAPPTSAFISSSMTLSTSATLALVTTLTGDHAIQLPSTVASPSPSADNRASVGAANDRVGRIIMIILVIIAGVAIVAALVAFLYRMCSSRKARRKERLSEIILPWSSPPSSELHHGDGGESSTTSSIIGEKRSLDGATPFASPPKAWLQPPRVPGYLRKPGSPVYGPHSPLSPFADSTSTRRFASASVVPPHADMDTAYSNSAAQHQYLGRRSSLPSSGHGPVHPAAVPAGYHLADIAVSPTDSLMLPAPWLSRRVHSRPNSIQELALHDGELVPATTESLASHIRSAALPQVDEPAQSGWTVAFRAGMAAAMANVATSGRAILRLRAEPDEEDGGDRFTRMPQRSPTRRKTRDVEREGMPLSWEKPGLTRTSSVASSVSSHAYTANESTLIRNWTTISRESDSSTAVAASDNEHLSPKLGSKHVHDVEEPSIHEATPISTPCLTQEDLQQSLDRSDTHRSRASNTSNPEDTDDDSLCDGEKNAKTLLLERRKHYLKSLGGLGKVTSVRNVAARVKSQRKKPGRTGTRK